MAKLLKMYENEEIEVDVTTKEGKELMDEVQENLFGQKLFEADEIPEGVTFGIF